MRGGRQPSWLRGSPRVVVGYSALRPLLCMFHDTCLVCMFSRLSSGHPWRYSRYSCAICWTRSCSTAHSTWVRRRVCVCVRPTLLTALVAHYTAIALTSPVVVSVASVTVVPATFLVDGVLRGDVQPILSYLGGVAILCGFVCLNFATWREKLVEARRAQHKRQEQARQAARWDNAPRAPLLSSPTPGVAAAVV